MDVKIPEPFFTALRTARPSDVCDAEATTPEAHYGRGLARLEAGRERAAHDDFKAALPILGDLCGVELAFLDIRHRVALEEAVAKVEDILTRARPGSLLRARALHVLGLARGKLRETEDAMAALLEAAGTYRELGNVLGRAQVLDTLGTLHASCGRLDLALSAYAISLVEKTMHGDRYGMAVTLGNLGRAHLKAGRFQDALDCFELDHKLAKEIGDRRGCAKMLNDQARARLGMGDLQRAEVDLRACLALALEGEYKDLEVFARKDLALVLMEQGRLDESSQEIDLAERALAGGTEPYLQSLLIAVRGQLCLARKSPAALQLLEEAAGQFAQTDLPDHEIPLWITLARAYVHFKLKRMGEVCLEVALERARRHGYDRYLREIRQTMALVGWSGNLVEERGRFYGPESKESSPDGYVLLDVLGSGAFGEVFRAYDPLRDQIVALKRFYVACVYDVEKRQQLLASAKLELEAASRIRHPGLARVFAMGYDQTDNLYVVQEFVKGKPLRELMAPPGTVDQVLVLKKAQLISSALAALHGAHVVHRDLKPENIILRMPNDSPVLVDCGIAYVPDFEEGFSSTGIRGTFPFVAPELFRGAPVTAKADMYSLGVVLYLWLAGRLPWSGEWKSWRTAVHEKLHVRPIPLCVVRADLMPEIAGLVERLMDSDPELRPDASKVVQFCTELIEKRGFRTASEISRELRRKATTETLYYDAWSDT